MGRSEALFLRKELGSRALVVILGLGTHRHMQEAISVPSTEAISISILYQEALKIMGILML
jgi:hypothetical protein